MSDGFKHDYMFSEDKEKIAIIFEKLEHVLTAEEVRRLVHFFAMRLDEMKPELPVDFSKVKPGEIFTADAYSIANHPESGTAQVFLRIPGLGWASVEFPPDTCEELAQALTRAIPDPGPGRLAH